MSGGVAHGLAVAAEGGDVGGGEFGLVEQVLHDAGVEAGEFLREQAAAVDFVCAAVLQGEQVVFQTT